MDAREVKDRMAQQAARVCGYLLPGGKVDGEEWVIGDVHGTKGTSFRVHLTGAKAGWWADFADSEYRGRNLLSLWMAVRGCDFVKAIREAKEFLGIRDERQDWKRATGPAVGGAPAVPGRPLAGEYAALKEGGKAWRWLTETRKIEPAVLKKYGVGESRDGEYVVFPSFTGDGVLRSLKFRNIEDKSKMFVLPKGAQKGLFGLQGIPGEQEDLFITEGEIDALTLATYGVPAVSVPFGAKWAGADGRDPNTEWLENDFEWLERFVEVFLCLDADEPGRKATESLIMRVGRTRCRVVEWPAGRKDANECLLAGLSGEEMVRILGAARNMDPEELIKPSAIGEDIWLEFFPDENDKARLGDATPWPAVKFTFNPGELTVWHGYSGNGKTILLNNLMLEFAAHGKRSCVASLEFPAAKTFKNIARAALGRGKPGSREEFGQVVRWMDEWFWLYAHIGETTADAVLDVFEYAAKKYGVQHFVLDSLMMLTEIGGEDYDVQKAICLRLKTFARDYQAHVHLVAHSKKPDSKHDPDKFPPKKYDISGSGNISNVADNVICVWRNKEKEVQLATAADFRRAGREEEAAKLEEAYSGREDARFIIQKNRETGEEFTRRLWFDKGAEGSWQYFDEETKGRGALRYWKP